MMGKIALELKFVFIYIILVLLQNHYFLVIIERNWARERLVSDSCIMCVLVLRVLRVGRLWRWLPVGAWRGQAACRLLFPWREAPDPSLLTPLPLPHTPPRSPPRPHRLCHRRGNFAHVRHSVGWRRHVLGRQPIRPAGDREHDAADEPREGTRCERREGAGLAARLTLERGSVCGLFEISRVHGSADGTDCGRSWQLSVVICKVSCTISKGLISCTMHISYAWYTPPSKIVHEARPFFDRTGKLLDCRPSAGGLYTTNRRICTCACVRAYVGPRVRPLHHAKTPLHPPHTPPALSSYQERPSPPSPWGLSTRAPSCRVALSCAGAPTASANWGSGTRRSIRAP
jgi:hypothetical protein